MADGPTFHAQAFGLRWCSEYPLHRFHPCTDEGPADVAVRAGPWPPAARAAHRHVGAVAFCVDGQRFTPSADVVIDIFPAGQVLVAQAQPAPLPVHFFGTATALVLGQFAMLPLHGCAVEIAGRAVLVCGHSGLGKSSFIAALIEKGARLISDDLSALVVDAAGRPCLLPGRSVLRLWPAALAYLGRRLNTMTQQHEPDGKRIVLPPCAGGLSPLPLHRIVILGEDAQRPLPSPPVALLAEQIYRSHLMLQLPHRSRWFEVLHAVSRRMEIRRAPAIGTDLIGFQAAIDSTWIEMSAGGP